MRKIFIKLTIIFALLLVIDRSLGSFIANKIYAKVYSGECGGTLNYLLEKKKNVDLLIIGSSRAKYQIDPALLSFKKNLRTYNAGISGRGGIIYNSILTEIILKNGVKPGYILLQTDPGLFIKVKDENLLKETIGLYPNYGKSERLGYYIQKAGFSEQVALLSKLYPYNGKMLNLIYNYSKRQSVKDNNGFITLNNTMDTTREIVRANLIYQDNEFSETKVEALKSIIQVCKKYGTTLVVVYPPTYSNCDYNASDVYKLNKIIQLEGGCSVVDLSDINKVPKLQSYLNWNDARHLNYKGAREFSLALNDSLKAKF